MFKIVLALVMGGIAGTVSGESLAEGDPNVGKALLEKSCTPCHVREFGGDGSKVYSRANRIVHNSAQLAARIRVCNTNADAGWFPDEEKHVAAYLNLAYYHFQ